MKQTIIHTKDKIFLFHQKHAPMNGRIFNRSDVPMQITNGWREKPFTVKYPEKSNKNDTFSHNDILDSKEMSITPEQQIEAVKRLGYSVLSKFEVESMIKIAVDNEIASRDEELREAYKEINILESRLEEMHIAIETKTEKEPEPPAKAKKTVKTMSQNKKEQEI